MLSRVLLGLIGLFNLAVGLVMIGGAEAWYWATPGVSQTGPMNHHFIVDIGLAFLASGAGMLAGFRQGRTAATFAFAGAVWPALHAAFHIFEWFVGGFPRDLRLAATELLGVVLIGFAGLALAFLRARKEGAI
jgi:hypothetical protein